ncbi:MAG: T9SS type A sorting domain-containing protein [Cryomorphaceae bacterium]|nr:T9SS type A sorting domain-containing protein [Cryomorphaceae bacterium]
MRVKGHCLFILLFYVSLGNAQNLVFNVEKAEDVVLHYPNIHGFYEDISDIEYQLVVNQIPHNWVPRLLIFSTLGKTLKSVTVADNTFTFKKTEQIDSLRIIWVYRPDVAEKSGFCMVDIACPEGQPYRNLGASVCLIYAQVGGQVIEGSGVLVNNTANDKTPYILTAEHIGLNFFTGNFAQQQELSNWIFEFNYERVNCGTGYIDSSNLSTFIGCELRARSFDNGGITGSDFALLEITDSLFSSNNLSFAGWSRSTNPPQNGVGIHHPKADVKKISFFNDPAAPGIYWGQNTAAHWELFWSGSVNGYGVTEGGSSGSPLFNENGLIVGTLSGGEASCVHVIRSDYYGMFHYSWDMNGSTPDKQLAPWLDPLQTNVTDLQGIVLSKTTFEDIAFEFFPNPVSGGETITLHATLSGEVQILNLQGKRLMVYLLEGNQPLEIIAPQTPGVYIIQIKTQNHVHTQKYIVQ